MKMRQIVVWANTSFVHGTFPALPKIWRSGHLNERSAALSVLAGCGYMALHNEAAYDTPQNDTPRSSQFSIVPRSEAVVGSSQGSCYTHQQPSFSRHPDDHIPQTETYPNSTETSNSLSPGVAHQLKQLLSKRPNDSHATL